MSLEQHIQKYNLSYVLSREELAASTNERIVQIAQKDKEERYRWLISRDEVDRGINQPLSNSEIASINLLDTLGYSEEELIKQKQELENRIREGKLNCGFKSLLLDVSIGLNIVGTSFKEFLENRLEKDLTNTNLLDIPKINDLFDEFLYSRMLITSEIAHLTKHYRQEVVSFAANALTVSLTQQGYIVNTFPQVASVDFEWVDFYINLVTKDINYLILGTETKNIYSLPGKVYVRFKVTGEGILLENIAASNHLLYQCLLNQSVVADTRAIQLAQAEEKLHSAIQVIRDHQKILAATGSIDKAQVAAQLAEDLTNKTKEFFLANDKSAKAINTFIWETKTLMAKAEPVLVEHRNWKGIAINIGIALTGVGALLMGLNKIANGYFSLYKTISHKKLEIVDKEFEALQKANIAPSA